MNANNFQKLRSYLSDLKELRRRAVESPDKKAELRNQQMTLSAFFSGVLEESRLDPRLREVADEIDKIIRFFNN